MPYKHNFWGTIERKGNYYKAPLVNLSALRPVHSVQFLSLAGTLACLFAMTEEFSDAKYVNAYFQPSV